MKLTTVLFDLGGVLLRTEDHSPRAKLASRYEMTYQELSDYIYRQDSAHQATLGEISAADHWQVIAEDLDLTPEELRSFQDEFWGGDIMDEFLVDFVRGLRPHYTTGLLSNAWDDLRDALTLQWKMIDAFDHVFISSELGMAKPDPRVYDHVLSELGKEGHEVVFLDDFVENVEAARKAGLHAIHFQNREQALGELQELLDNELI